MHSGSRLAKVWNLFCLGAFAATILKIKQMLQRNVAVLLPRSVLLLVSQHLQFFTKPLPGYTGLNNIVHKPSAGSGERVRKEVLIFCHILGRITAASKNDLNGTFGAHNCNFA